MKKAILFFGFIIGLTVLFPIKAQINELSAEKRTEINDIFNTLNNSQNFVTELIADNLYELPVGIKKTMGNTQYTLAISSTVFHQDYAEITAYLSIHAIRGETLIFGVSGLRFNFEGGFTGDATLALLGDIRIPFPGNNFALTFKGNLNMVNGQMGSGSTHVTIDCNGFKELFVNADLEFANIFIPCSDNGEKLNDVPLKTNIQMQLTNVNDFLLAINIPKFQIKGLDDFVFTVRNAVFDFSDNQNAPALHFPSNYTQNYFPITPVNLWQGVYIQEFEIMLPKAFQKRNSTNRISFGARDLLIDNNGVTGNFFVEHLLSINEGNASGWAFSLDELLISIEANTFKAARFNGNIRIPLAKEQNIHYDALISTATNEYSLTVAPKDSLTFNLWQAKVVLDNNSYLKMAVIDRQFRPEANLNGYMNMNLKANQSSSSIGQVDRIRFQNLHIMTESPYLDVDYFGYEGDIQIANLPASITELSISKLSNDILSFNIGARIELSNGSFGCGAGIGIETRLSMSNGEHHWTFERIRFDDITFKAEISGLKLAGALHIMNDDPVYGNGIKGEIGLGIEAIEVEIGVRAIFGKKNFAYWFVYGSATFPSIGSGYFNINGFMGGAYYKMRRMPGIDDYVPDASMGFGLRAGLMFNICSREVADCMAEFEIAFNSNMSLRYIKLFGSAKILSKLSFDGASLSNYTNKQKQKEDALLAGKSDNEKAAILEAERRKREQNPKLAAEEAAPEGTNPATSNGISAYLAMSYDFAAKTFHATLDVFVNFANGMLSGVNANHNAGTMVIHIEPQLWYIHAGTPTSPLGVKIGIGDLSVRSASYFMTGTSIPEMPMPPQKVLDILGLSSIAQAMQRNNTLLAEGRGVAFGANFSFASGDISFFPFYASVEAGMGFDISMIKQDHLYCVGNSEPVGINGWYAQGQLYAYLAGEIGIKVNLLFIKGKFPIITAGAAAMMTAKLPKPTTVEGYVGLRYSFLGGLIKGNSRFKFSFGHPCELEERGNPLDDIQIIADIVPRANTKTDVFNTPQLALNFAVGKSFIVPDESGNEVSYKISLDKFELTSGGQKIDGNLEWNDNKDKVSFNSHEVLPPNSTITLTATLSFLKLVNSSWQTVYEDGKKVEESQTITFTTGEAPEYIPLHNVLYCYPVIEQRNFFKNEASTGYIQLDKGQNYLFTVEGQIQRLVWEPVNGGNFIETDVAYNSADKRVTFNIPANLAASKDYLLRVVSKMPEGNRAYNENKNVQRIGNEDDYIEITQNMAEEIIRTDIGKVLIDYPFRTSAFNTFAEKITALHITHYFSGYINYRLFDLRLQMQSYEPFDLVELEGSRYSAEKPLVIIASDLEDDRYVRYMYPRLYQHFPFPHNITIHNRDTSIYGMPPAKAFIIRENYLTELHASNYSSDVVTKTFPYIYNIFTWYESDDVNIANQLANIYIGKPNTPHYIENLITWSLTAIPAGAYGTLLRYVLPDGSHGSSGNVIYHANNY